MKKVLNIWANIYIFASLIILPLYLEYNYFNILQAKRNCFLAIDFILLPLGAVFYIIALFRHKITFERLNLLDISVFSFALFTLLSSLLSGNFTDSFWGLQGWGVGSAAWILAAVSYFLLSRCIENIKNIWIPVFAVHAFIISIAVLFAAGIDVFSLHEGLIPEEKYLYYSTLGNANWWTGYLCLFVPMTEVFIIQCSNKLWGIIYRIFWVFLCFGMLVCATDALLCGFGLCSFFFVEYIFRNRSHMETFGELSAIFGMVLMIYSLLPCFRERIEALNFGIMKAVISPLAGMLILIFGILLVMVLKLYKKPFSKKVKTTGIIIAEGILCAAVAGCLYQVLTEFSDKWGSWRGRIWRGSVELFNTFTVKQKLFGIGPEMLRSGYQDISAWFNQNVLVSHSEPLQILLTTGIIGVSLWIIVWLSLLTAGRRSEKKLSCMAPFFLALTAYLGQALVNSVMTEIFAFLFIVISIARASLCKDKVLYKF